MLCSPASQSFVNPKALPLTLAAQTGTQQDAYARIISVQLCLVALISSATHNPHYEALRVESAHPARLRRPGAGVTRRAGLLARPPNHDCTGLETCASSVCRLEISPPGISDTLSSLNLAQRLLRLIEGVPPFARPVWRVVHPTRSAVECD